MERYDIQIDLSRNTWGLKKRDDGQGMFVYAEEAVQYKERYHMALIFAVAVAFGYVASTAYIVFHKHDPVPVQVSAAEYQQAIQLAERKEAEKATLRKQLADEHARRLLGDKMIKSLNATVAQHQQQLKDLQTSVPSQPIIVEAIRKGASTDKGFRQAVARSFGSEIAGRIEVRP